MTLRHAGDVGLTDVEVNVVMVKCPFCAFANEDGALFCEQCKSDISSVAPAPVPPPPPPSPTPLPESLPPAEIFPVAAVEEEAPVMAAVVEDTPMVEDVIAIAPV